MMKMFCFVSISHLLFCIRHHPCGSDANLSLRVSCHFSTGNWNAPTASKTNLSTRTLRSLRKMLLSMTLRRRPLLSKNGGRMEMMKSSMTSVIIRDGILTCQGLDMFWIFQLFDYNIKLDQSFMLLKPFSKPESASLENMVYIFHLSLLQWFKPKAHWDSTDAKSHGDNTWQATRTSNISLYIF